MPGPMSSMPQAGTPWEQLMAQQAQEIPPREDVQPPMQSMPQPQQAPPSLPEMTVPEVKKGVASGQLDPRQPVRVIAQTAGPASSMSPEQQAQNQAADSYLAQKQGISQLEDSINQAKSASNNGLDYRPFVAMSKFLNPNSDVSAMSAAADASAPDTPQARAQKLINLQNILQQRKGDLAKASDTQLAALLKAQAQNTPLKNALAESAIAKNNALAGNFAVGGLKTVMQTQGDDNNMYLRTVKSIEDDKTAHQKLAVINGIDNAGKILEGQGPDGPTPQSFQEYQQTVLGAVQAGRASASGVGERLERYLGSVGISAAKAKQWITGQPVGIGEGNQLMALSKEFAAKERANAQTQREALLATKGLALPSQWHTRNPDKSQALNALMSSYKDLGTMGDTNAQKIKVTNGKETLLIDPSDLDSAVKSGFTKAGGQ